MALHEKYSEYTQEEIYDIMRKNCIAHNCPYLCGIDTSRPKSNSKDLLTTKCCMYIDKTKHMRNCMPDECEHWKDKVEKRRRSNEY